MKKAVACLLGVCLVTAGCGGQQPVEERSRLTISEHYLELRVGEEKSLYAILEDSPVTPRFFWRSSNEEVALVFDGVVKGVGEGVAHVSVQTKESTATCKVVVADS